MRLPAGVAYVVILLWLSGCHQPQAPHADWIIRAQLVFLSADPATERAPLPRNQFRLFFPYIAGDIYGSPTTGDFINPVLGSDYRFEIDLNRSHAALLASLEPTDFSVPYLKITPADARVARLAPMVLQADGIEPVGRTDWLDGDSRRTLMLLYLDRPATIAGKSATVQFAIQSATAGYLWVGSQVGPAGTVYTAIPAPAHVLLAVTPLQNPSQALGLPQEMSYPQVIHRQSTAEWDYAGRHGNSIAAAPQTPAPGGGARNVHVSDADGAGGPDGGRPHSVDLRL